MGWSTTYKPPGIKATDYLLHHSGTFSWGPDCPATYKVLDTAIVNLKTFYAAVERIDKTTGERMVWAAVCLLGYWPKSDNENFGWKSMDESMGPCEASCPERILKLLTPMTNEYAIEWRARCWTKIEARRARPKIKVGSTLKLYGKPYLVLELNAYGKAGWRVKGDDGTIYFASHVKLRQAADIKDPV